MNKLWSLTLLLVFATLVPTGAPAATIPLIDNQVIIDNAPFYSIGPEDGLGSGNYALNNPSFIDIPYAIFDFGATSSVSNATLTWNFGSLFGDSPPAIIALYAGSDASGTITTSDRFMGTLVDTFTVSGGEFESWDVTAFVNAALQSGQYFAVRLEATVPPDQLQGYYGGQFMTPSLTADEGGVPEPGTLVMFGSGIVGLAGVLRRKINL